MITKAIQRAYTTMVEREWDTIYWAIDLHGVCLESNYASGIHTFINEQAVKTLRLISSLPETKIILWSSAHEEEQAKVIKLFNDNGILVYGFNENKYEKNTKTGCFDKKFYFSVLLDDKAGFDPDKDWLAIETWFKTRIDEVYLNEQMRRYVNKS